MKLISGILLGRQQFCQGNKFDKNIFLGKKGSKIQLKNLGIIWDFLGFSGIVWGILVRNFKVGADRHGWKGAKR